MEVHKFDVVSANMEVIYSIYNTDCYGFDHELFIKKIGEYDVEYAGKVFITITPNETVTFS